MKISSIVNNIEFIRPRGELEDYRYGVKVNRNRAVVANDTIQDNSDVVQADFRAFKSELSKATKAVKPEIELVGKDE